MNKNGMCGKFLLEHKRNLLQKLRPISCFVFTVNHVLLPCRKTLDVGDTDANKQHGDKGPRHLGVEI